MLTTIEEVVKSYPSVKALYNFKKVPMDDFKVWLLYHRGDVKGIFQVESELCKQWCKKIKPSNIDELSALISLIRPGGLESGFAEKYANIKCGEETLSYIHNALIPALSPTYSCLVFQEQILRICIDIAGFDEVQADNARRAVGKKLPEEMVKVKKEFLECAKKRAIVSEEIAEEIFSWIQKSVRYLFNAAHSYSYGYISYFTAWQKCYYPTEFYTAALTYSSEKVDPKEEIYELVQDARLHNINVYPPSLHSRNTDFEIMDDKKILFGLSHIRGVGRSAVEVISGLKLDTFKDFVSNLKKIHRNVAESLIKSGACDCYGHSRTKMLRMVHIVLGRTDGSGENIPAEVRKLTPNEFNQFIKEIDQGFEEALKSIITTGKCIPKRVPTIEAKINYINEPVADTNTVKAVWEKLYLGLPLTCSAADDYKKEAEGIKTCKQVHQLHNKQKFVVHVVLDKVAEKKTSEKSKNPGQKFAFIDVSDNSAALKLAVWPNQYEKFKDDLIEGTVLEIWGYKDSWQGRDQVTVNKIVSIG
jgi:DNA polymerase-3 subunit alpha